jgi:AcrR family transcriptional regulator
MRMPKGISLTDQSILVRRQQIADAAKKLFLEHGYHQTSMQNIADAAESGKSTLYDYFSTKDDILVAILEAYISDLTVRAQEIANQEISPIDKLKRIMFNHMRFLLDSRQLLGLLTVEVQRLGVLQQQKFQVRRKVYQDLICRIIQQAIEEGYLNKDIDPEITTNIALAMTSPTVVAGISRDKTDQVLEKIVNIFLYGVMK